MSSATVTSARPLPAPRRALQPPPLRVLPSSITDSGNGRFAAMCVGILTLGLVALLLLNTALAKGAIELTRLERDAAVLDDQTGNLRETIDQASATGVLARKATSLGMVRSNERAYIDLEAGTVTGTAAPANRYQKLPIVVSPTPQPKPEPTASTTDGGTPAPSAPSATPTTGPSPSATATTAPADATPSAGEGPTAGSGAQTPATSPQPKATATSAGAVDSVE